jgi:histidyl-tRNA synthetase
MSGESTQMETRTNRPLERLRGVDDVLPPAARRLRDALNTLSGVAESYGYELVDVPLLEPTEVFLRKSGESLAPKLYAFTHANRDLCVRPEFTASVGRLYVNQLQDAPLPLRLYYAGPVMRHEKPGRGRRRQFTQLGLELIGAAGAPAEAEVILAAVDGLNALGIGGYRVVLGHLGATLEMLNHLSLDNRARSFVLSNLENLARTDRGLPYVEARLEELYPVGQSRTAIHLPTGARRQDARALLTGLLDRLDDDAALGGRRVDEIVESMLERFTRPDQVPLIRQALDLAGRLHTLSGAPGQALPAAAELLAAHGVSEGSLRDLEEIVSLLTEAGLPEDMIEINLGFGRGLHYYTGMIFEIYCTDERFSGQPLCGGGRYDDLMTAMGGRVKTPACGFAYVAQRLMACLPETDASTGVDVLIEAESEKGAGAAMRLARQLRQAGLRVESDVRGRKGRAVAQYAARSGIRYVLTLVEEEGGRVYRLWDRQTGGRERLDEAGLLRWANQILHEGNNVS